MGNPFSKPKVSTPPPPPPPPPVMPVADDAQIKMDQRRKAAQRSRRSGRVSTILSQNDGGTLGGG